MVRLEFRLTQQTTSAQAHEKAPEEGDTSPFFMSLVQWVLDHPRVTLGNTLAITLLMGLATFMVLRVDNSLEVFAPPDSEVVKSRSKYQSLFGRDDLFLISARGDVFTVSFLSKIRDLEEELKKINPPNIKLKEPFLDQSALAKSASELSSFHLEEEDLEWAQEGEGSIVEETTSIVSARKTSSVEDGIIVKPWFEPVPLQTQIDQLKKAALSDPLLKRRIVDDQGNFTVIMVKVALMTDDELMKVYRSLCEVIERHQSEGFVLKVTGPPAVAAALNEVVLSDLSTLLILSGIAMTLALLFLFRSLQMVIGPIVVVGISVIWTMGFMSISGMSINLLSSILPAFLLCVGLGDSIHLQSIYLLCARDGLSRREAIIKASGMTGPPILFTSLTTMIGLFSFQFASVTAIKEMGIAGGVGVIFALLHSLVTLPLFLKNLPEKVSESRVTETDNALSVDRIDHILAVMVSCSASTAGRRAVIIVMLILTSISAYGVSQLQVWHDDLEALPNDNPIKIAVQEVDQALGGVANAQLLINAERAELGLRDIHILHALDALAQHSLQYRDADGNQIVGHALSISDVVKETRRALSGDEALYRLPSLDSSNAQEETSQLLNLFELQSPEQLKSLTTIDMSHAHLTIQVQWLEATSYAGLIEHMRQGIEKYFGERDDLTSEVKPTGGIYLAYTIVSSLLDDLLKSFSAAFLVITLLMVLMLRGLKLGSLAMIPNLFPILLMLGTIGLLGIPLDLNTLLIASIALGIAVDDTIHLLHHFQVSYQVHGDPEKAILEALNHAGRAMVSTSVLLSTGFAVYLFASTEAVQRFGLIISLTVLVALIVDLIICPAILRLAYAKTAS